MRPLEAALIIVLVVGTASLFVRARTRPRWLHLVPSPAAGVALVQLAVEKCRWQMAAAYLLTILIFVFTFSHLRIVFGVAAPALIESHAYRDAELPSGDRHFPIVNFSHANFSDFSLYGRGSLVRLLGIVGPIDGRRCLRIQNDYVRAFFDRYLKGEDPALLHGPSPAYPEVRIEVRNPSGPGLDDRAAKDRSGTG